MLNHRTISNAINLMRRIAFPCVAYRTIVNMYVLSFHTSEISNTINRWLKPTIILKMNALNRRMHRFDALKVKFGVINCSRSKIMCKLHFVTNTTVLRHTACDACPFYFRFMFCIWMHCQCYFAADWVIIYNSKMRLSAALMTSENSVEN